jgi:hypothetical protein
MPVLYFSTGEFMNSRILGSVVGMPIGSQPAELKGHKIEFYGPEGKAVIEECENSSVHGVVHLMMDEQMRTLD